MSDEFIRVELTKYPTSLSDRIVAFSAIAISLIALVLSIWQAKEIVKHNKLSVLPNLEIYQRISPGEGWVGIQIKSSGLGPAVMSNLRIYLDGQLASDWNTVSNSVQGVWLEKNPYWSESFGDIFLKAGTSYDVYFTDDSNIADFRGLRELILHRVAIGLNVCSVYGDCKDICLGRFAKCEGITN